MASRLNPYISFKDNAREAMEFYRDALGGNLAIDTFGQYGMQDTPMADNVMHARLDTDKGFTIMASDTPPEVDVQPGNTIAISLSGDDEAELRGYWDKLSAGGTITMPIEKQMWGDIFGMFTDRFGVGWMVNITHG